MNTKIKTLMKLIVLLLFIGLISCSSMERIAAESSDGNTYKTTEVGELSTVSEGVIIAIRKVTIAGSKGLGAATGGAVGAVTGSTINKAETDRAIAGSLGALAGAVVGSMIEENLTEKDAFEFVIKLDSGRVVSLVQNTDQELKVGDNVYIIKSSEQVRIARK